MNLTGGVNLKFLANENFPRSSVQALREFGWDVISIAERFPGISDRQVLELACQECRIILTFDADYGELVFHKNVAAPPAIVYLRFVPTSAIEAAQVVSAFVAQHYAAINGFFFTLDRTLVRKRHIA